MKKTQVVDLSKLADDDNEKQVGDGSLVQNLASDILQWSEFGKMIITMRKLDEDAI